LNQIWCLCKFTKAPPCPMDSPVETRGFQLTGNRIHLDSVLNLSPTVSWTLKRDATGVLISP